MSQTSTIPYDFPPSIDQILERIPPLVNLLASEAFSPGLHDVYGGNDPYPAMLHLLLSIFPPARGFVPAPQGPFLRPVTNLSGSEGANIASLSFSSAGAAPLGRVAGEAEARKGFLDIAISKIYPDGHGDYTTKTLAIVVVERDDPTHPQSVLQIARYLELEGPQSHDERLQSYIVLGDRCIALDLPAPTQGGRNVFPVLVGSTDSKTLLKELCGLAIRHWNQ